MLLYDSLEYFIENREEDTEFYSPRACGTQNRPSLGYGDFSLFPGQ